MSGTVRTTIASINRRRNTESGNPRYRLLTLAGVFETADDSQVNHLITDRLAERPRPEVELSINDAGKVIAIKEFPRSEA